MKFIINPKTYEVTIDVEERPAFCYACAKWLGRVLFFKGDSITESCLSNVQPLCYDCMKKLVPKPAEIKI